MALRNESRRLQKAGPLGRQAYHALRQAIRDGIILPNHHYSEPELAELLGVSRTPVREALKRLERDGVLEVVPQRGYRLRSFSEEEVVEFVELRKVLERFTVSSLITRLSEGDLARLARILEGHEQGEMDVDIFASDEEFHLAIAELAGLPWTKETLASLRSVMAIIGAGAQVSKERTRQAVSEHYLLLDAISRRDRMAALTVLDRHIEDSTRALLEGKRRVTSRRAAMRLESE